MFPCWSIGQAQNDPRGSGTRDVGCSPHAPTWQGVLAPTTAVIALITLNQVCRFALRRGWLADNPVARLEPCEKPCWTPGRVGILEGEDLAKVLAHAGSYWPLFMFLACTGLRIGEALGLVWARRGADGRAPG